MTETKIELTSRLRREGREEEAARFRHQVREQLKAEGKTRSEALEGSCPQRLECGADSRQDGHRLNVAA